MYIIGYLFLDKTLLDKSSFMVYFLLILLIYSISIISMDRYYLQIELLINDNYGKNDVDKGLEKAKNSSLPDKCSIITKMIHKFVLLIDNIIHQ